MSHPAEGLLSVLEHAGCFGLTPEQASRVVSAWQADHLDALAETGKVDHGSFRLAAAEVRAAGGVE